MKLFFFADYKIFIEDNYVPKYNIYIYIPKYNTWMYGSNWISEELLMKMPCWKGNIELCFFTHIPSIIADILFTTSFC